LSSVGTGERKFEIRSTKSDTNPKQKEESTKRELPVSGFLLWICCLFRISYFELRASQVISGRAP
jgi:hypothetical protein